MPHLRYYLGLAVAIVAVSFTAIFIRLAEAPALTIATGRMVATVLLVLPPLLAFERHGIEQMTKRDLLLSTLSGLFLALHFALWTVSLGYTSVASSVVFVSVHPIFVAVIAWAFLGERLTAGILAGIALTFVGSVLIGISDLQLGGESLFGDLLALGGAAAIVGYLLIGKVVRRRQGLFLYSMVVYLSCAVALAAMAIASGVSLFAFSNRDLLVFFALAVATQGGHTVFNWVLKHLPASLVAVSFVGEPAGSALLAWVILAEPIGALTAVGGLAMLLGIYLSARSS